jgi:hypothetical protein
MNWTIPVDLRVLLVIAILLLVAPATLSQQQQWQFFTDREVSIYASRSLSSPLLGVIPAGGVLTITGPYVFQEELIWARLAEAPGYAPVARYGKCEIRSFGVYNPASQAPVSVGE